MCRTGRTWSQSSLKQGLPYLLIRLHNRLWYQSKLRFLKTRQSLLWAQSPISKYGGSKSTGIFPLSSGYTWCRAKIILQRSFLNVAFTKRTDPLKKLSKASFIACHNPSVRSFLDLLWTQYHSTTFPLWAYLLLRTLWHWSSELLRDWHIHL